MTHAFLCRLIGAQTAWLYELLPSKQPKPEKKSLTSFFPVVAGPHSRPVEFYVCPQGGPCQMDEVEDGQKYWQLH